MKFINRFKKPTSNNTPQTTPNLSDSLKKTILSRVGIKNIPPMPKTAQKAFQLASDPTAEADKFIDLIESDESLSARVIKIANSVYFDRGKKSNSIEEAVLLIGVNELRSLLSANTLTDIFPSSHPARKQFWINDIACALIARTLAQRLLPSKSETLFLGGLMHDLGKLLLLQRNEAEYLDILNMVGKEGTTFIEAEVKLFPFDHTEVGQLIGEKWSFSEELLAIIRNHHTAWEEFKNHPQLSPSTIIKAADIFAHALGLGHPQNFGRFRNKAEEETAQAWEVLGISSGDQKNLLNNFKRIFETEHELYLMKPEAGSRGA